MSTTRRAGRPVTAGFRSRARQLLVDAAVATCALSLAALGAVSLVGVAGAPAQAIPPGGASSDTEGTAASISPSTLRAGETITFRISGFPAGETVSVKIDDGDFCSQKGIHGACVVHQQKVGANGSVQGSFALPEDLGAGKHWLRFLASAEMTDSEGRYVGVKPYSLRGGANFTVVTKQETTASSPRTGAATPTTGTGGTKDPGTSGPSSTTAADPTTTDAPTTAADSAADDQDSNAQDAADEVAEVLVVPAPPGSAGEGDAPVAAAETSADDASGDVVAEAAADSDEFPWIGAVVLTLAVVLAGAWVLRSRARA